MMPRRSATSQASASRMPTSAASARIGTRERIAPVPGQVGGDGNQEAVVVGGESTRCSPPRRFPRGTAGRAPSPSSAASTGARSASPGAVGMRTAARSVRSMLACRPRVRLARRAPRRTNVESGERHRPGVPHSTARRAAPRRVTPVEHVNDVLRACRRPRSPAGYPAPAGAHALECFRRGDHRARHRHRLKHLFWMPRAIRSGATTTAACAT